MKKIKAILTAAISTGCVLISAPVKAELAPEAVARGVYQGIQQIHGFKATPRLVWNVPPNQRGGCGAVRSSHYCGRDHTVYIAQQDIRFAYRYGDAALAYIIAHEYAHAMQVAFGFMPRSTPAAELQADCLAGVYLNAIPNLTLDDQDVREITTFAYRIGDYAQWSRQHHGTPTQRVQAVALGLQSSKEKGLAVCRIN